MNDYKIIDLIKYEYLKIMNNDKYNQKQKNIKYASLMTVVYDGWREPLCSLYESHHQTAS